MPDDQIPADTLIAIEQALTLLSETYRQVFILRKVQDLSVADTAKILGWSQVKVRVTYSVSGIGFADRKKASGISF